MGKTSKSIPMDTKEGMSFRKSIAANTPDALHERVKAPGTIEGFRVRFYPGQELTLQVNVYVVHLGQKVEQLVTYVATGDAFLSGDDEVLEFHCVCSVETDDLVFVSVMNTDAVNAHRVAVDVYVDYYGGNQRLVGGGA